MSAFFRMVQIPQNTAPQNTVHCTTRNKTLTQNLNKAGHHSSTHVFLFSIFLSLALLILPAHWFAFCFLHWKIGSLSAWDLFLASAKLPSFSWLVPKLGFDQTTSPLQPWWCNPAPHSCLRQRHSFWYPSFFATVVKLFFQSPATSFWETVFLPTLAFLTLLFSFRH